MFTRKSMQSPELQRLTRTVYLFGSSVNGPYGNMTFGADGRVKSRRETNEHSYRLSKDGLLSFLTPSGQISSVLAAGPNNSFVPLSGRPHYLHPVLELGSPPAPSSLAPVFLNTVPKAGTYLLARALEHIGYTNAGLHVMDEFLHDNRGVPEQEIHWDPSSREVVVSSHAVATVLRPGEFVVGHVDTPQKLQDIKKTGITFLNVIREPRSQLLSMFVFLQKKVKPTPAASLWQSMEGIDAFKGFLLSSPIRQWVDQSLIMAGNHRFLRYEDVLAAKPNPRGLTLSLSRKLPKAIAAVKGEKTSTYIRDDRRAVSDFVKAPEVLAMLEALGAMDLSRKYWPELN